MPFFQIPRFLHPNNFNFLRHNYYYYNKNPPTSSVSFSSIPQIATANNDEHKKNNSKNSQDCFFELFGLNLYFDDILLISLIFFLYQEGVKDEELFVSLILLLLS